MINRRSMLKMLSIAPAMPVVALVASQSQAEPVYEVAVTSVGTFDDMALIERMRQAANEAVEIRMRDALHAYSIEPYARG
ncbi:MAG: hypothetical protein JWQ74_3521 [Marmoricola sp.]|nr:hypothetical protein [Marmoricola sp.]